MKIGKLVLFPAVRTDGSQLATTIGLADPRATPAPAPRKTIAMAVTGQTLKRLGVSTPRGTK